MTEENVNIKIVVDTKATQQNLGSARKEMSQLTNQVKDLAAEIEKSGDPTGELTKKLNGLQKELGQLKDATSDAMSRVKYMADDFAQVKTALQGISAGIAVFQGMTAAAELFGIKNEKALEIIKKLQIAQAALNAVNTIAQALNKDSYLMIGLKIIKEQLLTKVTQANTKAQLANNAAVAATPWGAILAVIGLVIAAVTTLTSLTNDDTKANLKNADSVDKKREANDRYNESIRDAEMEWAKQNAMLNEYKKILNDTSKSEIAHKTAIEGINKILGTNYTNTKQALKGLESYESGITKSREALIQANAEVKKQEELYKSGEGTFYAYEQSLAKQAQATYNLEVNIEKWKKANNNIIKSNKKVVESNNEVAKSQKNVLESAKEIGKDLIAEQAKNEKTIALNVAKEITEAKLANAEKYSQSYYDLQKNLAKNEYDLYIDSLKNRLAEGLLLQDEYDELAREKRKELANTFVAIQQEQKDRQKEIDDQQQEDFKNKQAERIQTVADTAGAIASIMSQLGSMVMTIQNEELANAEGNEAKQKEIKKKYAKTNAAIQIAQTIMTTIQSAVNAYNAMAGIPYVGPVLGAIAAAAAAAFGAVQIHSIEAQKQKILSARRGDFVIGKSHEQGGVPYELEGGEAVLNKKAMAIPEYRSLASAMNESTGGVRFPNTSPVSLGVNKQDIQNIVAETVAGITAIPVVVTERSITETQARVAKIKEQSII